MPLHSPWIAMVPLVCPDLGSLLHASYASSPVIEVEKVRSSASLHVCRGRATSVYLGVTVTRPPACTPCRAKHVLPSRSEHEDRTAHTPLSQLPC